MLTYDAAGDCYRMHPLVDERARAQAKRSDVWAATLRAHQEYYAALLRGLRRPLLGTVAGPRCHTERYHQGLAGRLIRSPLVPGNDNYSIGAIASRARLGGLLNFYFLDAA